MSSITIQNGEFGKLLYDKQGNVTAFESYGVACYIAERRRNLETDQLSFKLVCTTNNRQRDVIISFSEMSNKQTLIEKAYSIGCLFNPKHIDSFYDSLLLQLKTPQQYPIATVFEYSGEGWIDIPETNILAYRADKLIAKRQYQSEYQGRYNLKAAGDANITLSCIRKNLLGRPPLEVALCVALAAVFIGLLGLDSQMMSIFYNIVGESSIGKSAILQFLVSLYCSPVASPRLVKGKRKLSLYGSWNSTPISALQQMSNNYGALTVLEDFGRNTNSNIASLIYNLTDASPRMRNNSNYDVEVGIPFATVIASASEFSIKDSLEQKTSGMDIRLIECEDVRCESAEQADELKAVAAENYGEIAAVIAQWVINCGGKEYVKPLYEKWVECSKYALPTNHLSQRFGRSFYAPIMLACEVSSVALNLNFDRIGIQKYLANYCKSYDSSNHSSLKSYETVIDVCKVNMHKFLTDSSIIRNQETWGRYNSLNETLSNGRTAVGEFCLYKLPLYKMLDDNGFKNPTSHLKDWRKQGLLDCDAGHLTNKRTITKENERTYNVRVLASNTSTAINTNTVFDITQLPEGITTYRIDNIVVDFSTGTITEVGTSVGGSVDLKSDSMKKTKTNREILLNDDDEDDYTDDFANKIFDDVLPEYFSCDYPDIVIDYETGEVMKGA